MTQAELEYIFGLRGQARRLRRLYRIEVHNLIDRLLAGAPVQPGTHTAELTTTARGTARITRVILE